MIHLPIKNKTSPPERLTSQGALKQIQKVVASTDGTLYTTSYYPHIEVLRLLRAFSIHKNKLEPGDVAKCNYCESQIEHGVTLQVEHYRPKAKIVAGENDHVELPGYYWLGLEWTNLLLSCPKCNGRNAKGNKFPIRGIRASPLNPISGSKKLLLLNRTGCNIVDSQLAAEDPLLLNPEVDFPEQYLTFTLTGKVTTHGKDPMRGDVSIETYRLNRDELFFERKRIWDEFKKEILLVIYSHQTGDFDDKALNRAFMIICNKISERKLPNKEFTAWGKFINSNLQQILEYDSDIPEIYRRKFLKVFGSTQLLLTR